MSEVVRSAPKGLAAARFIKAIAVARGDVVAALAYGEGSHVAWKSTPEVVSHLRTAVSALSGINTSPLAQATMPSEFLELLRPRTISDRMQGWRRVPANSNVLLFSGDASGYVVDEGSAKPLSKFTLERVSLPYRKVAAIVVLTQEVLRNADPSVELSIATELAKAVGQGADAAMFDLGVSGSLTHDGIVLTSAGTSLANIDSDLQRMLSYMSTNDEGLDAAYWCMSPVTAGYLGSLRGTGGAAAFPNVGVRGGSILGIPVVVSANLRSTGSPTERQIVLVNPSRVLLADPAATSVTVARNASIQLDDAPSSNASQVVSLFQMNAVGIKGERFISWKLAEQTGCVTLAGVNY
jgi:HK97 family phage major capsid protein